MTTQKEGKGVLIGMRAGGNCVLCQHKKRCGRLSFCTAFGNGVEAIKQYFRCRYHTDPGEEENSFKMIKGGFMEMKCYHCGYEWDYRGASEFYCTCPKCMMKVNIKKAIRLIGDDVRFVGDKEEKA